MYAFSPRFLRDAERSTILGDKEFGTRWDHDSMRNALEHQAKFIGAWFLENTAVCDDLVTLFQSRPEKVRGGVQNTLGECLVDVSIKDDLELAIEPTSATKEFQAYLTELQKVVLKYIDQFPFCNSYSAWTIVEPVNLQCYLKGGGYKTFHTERISGALPNAARHLAFMTYLNDVMDGGGTEFIHQNVIVSARKGLTLIWPADWTHTHRGIISPTEEKFIITGWFSYFPSHPTSASRPMNDLAM